MVGARRCARATRLLVRLCVPVVVAVTPAAAHPVHTTLTEIARGSDGVITLRIRVFADDFSAAASRFVGGPPPRDHAVSDSTAARYVARFVRLEHGMDVVRLVFAGQRRDGEVIWIDLRGRVRSGSGEVRLVNALLFDLHADQVNLVQTRGGRTVLFTRGEGPKEIRL